MGLEARDPLRMAPLAGRQRELGTSTAPFEAARGGRLQVLLVAGEPGIGKSRLLEEVAARATRDSSVTVLRGGASEIAGMPPYLPILEALGAFIETAHIDQLRRAAGTSAAILFTIIPELAQRLGDLAPPYPLLPDQARLRLFSSVGSFLTGIAAQEPVLLLLDDLHWSDAATLDMLCHIASHQPAARLLICGAYREGEAAANPALVRAIDYLNRARVLTSLTLSPLSSDEIAALTTGYLGGPVDVAASRLLHAHSEGNPFFAEELLRSWVETGGLSRRGDRWMLSPTLDPGHIPPGITGTIHQRLLRLPPGVVELLEIAAVIGKTFAPALVAGVAGQARENVDSGLQAASRAGLIHAEAAGTFVFGHDKIRETLYAELSPGRRESLHGAVGHELESRGDEHNTSDLAALAFHFVRSGDRARGATYCFCAAEKALAAHAAAEALTHYRAALGLLSSNDDRRGNLLLGLGKAAGLTEALTESVDAYQAAYDWALQRGDRWVAARAARGLGGARQRLTQFAAAREAYEAAVALTRDQAAPEAVYALADLAEFEPFIGLFHEGLAHAEQALRLARAGGEASLEAKTFRALGRVLTRMNNIPAGIEALERALALATQVDDPVEAATCCYRLEYVTMNTGELKRCRELCLTRTELARRSHDVFELCHAQAWLAYVAALQGSWSEVEEMIASVEPAAERLASSEPLTFLLKAAGFMAYQRGEYRIAEEKLLALEAIFRRTPEALGRYRGGLLGLAHFGAGNREGAIGYRTEYEALLSSLPEGSTPTAPILTALAMMALVTGDRQRAQRYYSRLRSFQGQHYWFLVDRILAAIEVLRGDWTAAEMHLDAAEKHARCQDLRPELPLVLVGRADLELARGGPGSALRARTLYAQALELLGELGMVGEETRVRERRRSLPSQPGSHRAQVYPAGLSDREVEVLRLVAAGLSNREIARRLALSEKTVANHLTTIFNKTGTDNRTAASTFAIRQGLA